MGGQLDSGQTRVNDRESVAAARMRRSLYALPVYRLRFYQGRGLRASNQIFVKLVYLFVDMVIESLGAVPRHLA